MKNYLLAFFVFAYTFGFQFLSFAVEDFKINDNGELIIAFEKLSDKQLTYFDEVISQIPGIKNTGYCQRLKIYVFSYDKSVYRTDEDALNAITQQTKKFIPILKIGTPSDEIIRNCNNQN